MNGLNVSGAASARAKDAPDDTGARKPPPNAEQRERFESAVERAARGRRGSAEEGEGEDAGDGANAVPSGAQALAAVARELAGGQGSPGSGNELPTVGSVLASTQGAHTPWAAAPPDAAAGAALQPSVATRLAFERVHAPATEAGAQRWEFALAAGQGPVTTVQLQAAAAGAPWRLALQTLPRDRAQLQPHLDRLRSRLQTRGAPVADVHLQDGDNP